MSNKIALLTTKSSWFVPYIRILQSELLMKGISSKQFFDHTKITKEFDTVFMLCYHNITDETFLKEHQYNIVVHSSNLPTGKGWAPLFWQIINGKNDIPIVLFEAVKKVDSGPIYLEDIIYYNGSELNYGLRHKLGLKINQMVIYFILNHKTMFSRPQIGKESFYPKRNQLNSELNINKSIKEQFNLLRTVHNDKFPAFFYYNGQKYLLKITKGQD